MHKFVFMFIFMFSSVGVAHSSITEVIEDLGDAYMYAQRDTAWCDDVANRIQSAWTHRDFLPDNIISDAVMKAVELINASYKQRGIKCEIKLLTI